MKDWKTALWLAKFELTTTPLYLLALYILGPFFTIVLTMLLINSSFQSYLTANFVGFDLLFIFIFILFFGWLKPSKFQLQPLNNKDELWASPTLIMQLQLPIPIKTLIKSRFIIYFFYTFPFQCIVLCSIYLFSPAVRSLMTPGQFLVFCILWLSCAIYAGFIIPAGDVGGRFNAKSIAISFFSLVVGLILILTLFHLVVGYGLVYTTILLVQRWPLASAIGSMIMAILGLIYWRYYMKKSIYKIDYL